MPLLWIVPCKKAVFLIAGFAKVAGMWLKSPRCDFGQPKSRPTFGIRQRCASWSCIVLGTGSLKAEAWQYLRRVPPGLLESVRSVVCQEPQTDSCRFCAELRRLQPLLTLNSNRRSKKDSLLHVTRRLHPPPSARLVIAFGLGSAQLSE